MQPSGADPPPVPVPENSQDALNKALTRKADIEARVAAQSLTRWTHVRETLNSIAGLGGLLLAVAALVTGFITVLKWFDDRAKDRDLQIETQLNSAIALLSSPRSSDRAAVVVTLNSFISNDQPGRNRRVTMAVAGAIAGENDFFAERAMVEFFNTLDYGQIDAKTKNATLRALISYDRALAANVVLHGTLSLPLPLEQDEKLRALASVAQVIAKLSVNGAHDADYSGLYLADVDLRNAQLDGVDLTNSILAYADLTGASLKGAMLRNTDVEGARFASAHLQGATLSYIMPDVATLFFDKQTHSVYFRAMAEHEEFNFLVQFARHLQTNPISSVSTDEQWPTFRCADLTGAMVQGLVIGYVPSSESGINFQYANFAGTKFSPYLYSRIDDPSSAFETGTNYTRMSEIKRGDKSGERAADKDGGETVWLVHPSAEQRLKNIELGEGAFKHSNWAKAIAAPWVKAYMGDGTKSKSANAARPDSCSHPDD